jgi:CBS domain-containing protein
MPQVRDRMVSTVVTIEPGTGVVDAAKRMIQEEKGPLPIVEGERPVAIVTDRDIIAHVVAEGRDPKSMTVDNIASEELVTIGPEKDINEARRLMDEHELDRILVVEDDRLVGIISEADIRSDEGPLRGVTGGTTRQAAQTAQEGVTATGQTVGGLLGAATGAVTDVTSGAMGAAAEGSERAVEAVAFPIEGYDEMNVDEISTRLNDLSVEELQLVRDYEELNKRRESLLERMDRKIRSA